MTLSQVTTYGIAMLNCFAQRYIYIDKFKLGLEGSSIGHGMFGKTRNGDGDWCFINGFSS